MIHFLRLALCFCLFSSYIFADTEESEPVKVALIFEEQTIQPGRPFWVGLKMDIAPHWHTYWKNPGDAGMPTAITWTLPSGFTADTALWPTPKKFTLDSTIGFGYDEPILFLTQITPSADSSATSADIHAEVRWVVCSDTTCIPGDAEVQETLAISSAIPSLNPSTKEAFAQGREALPQKNENITVRQSQDQIEIRLEGDEYIAARAYFFPESENAVDYTIEPVLQKTANTQSVLLKAQTQDVPELKGILLLEWDDDTIAYELEHPIEKQNLVVTISSSPSAFEGGMGLAILFAFLGGMILNLMPCVLPVISFKVLSFVQMAGESRRLIFKHGLAFSLGVLISFWLLAGAMLMLQAYGHAVGWGFQLQDPLFVAILAAVLLVFGLSLFGMFEMGTSLISIAGQAQTKKNGYVGSLFSGVLATAVATPCTGPFLGSAVGFAVTLPALKALFIFTFLGLGMSFPYLLLAGFPTLLRFIPKAGPWMVTFKELMGFFMLGTVLWLTWVFGAQTSSFALFLLLAGFFLLAFGSWIYGKWGRPLQKQVTRFIGYALTCCCLFLASYTIMQAASPWAAEIGEQTIVAEGSNNIHEWEKFSPEKVAELQKKGVPVFVDFTAKWCLICQANHLILQLNHVDQKFAEQGVVKMKADWTKNDPVITEELRKYGRSGVPLYVLYGKAEEHPTILPQVLTPEIILNHLQKIETKS